MESILIARAAPSALGRPSQFHSCESVCQSIINSPRALVGAHIRLSTILTSVLCSHVGEWIVLFVAGLDWLVHRGLA
jgi:hypothetical protein